MTGFDIPVTTTVLIKSNSAGIHFFPFKNQIKGNGTLLFMYGCVFWADNFMFFLTLKGFEVAKIDETRRRIRFDVYQSRLFQTRSRLILQLVQAKHTSKIKMKPCIRGKGIKCVKRMCNA